MIIKVAQLLLVLLATFGLTFKHVLQEETYVRYRKCAQEPRAWVVIYRRWESAIVFC